VSDWLFGRVFFCPRRKAGLVSVFLFDGRQGWRRPQRGSVPTNPDHRRIAPPAKDLAGKKGDRPTIKFVICVSRLVVAPINSGRYKRAPATQPDLVEAWLDAGAATRVLVIIEDRVADSLGEETPEIKMLVDEMVSHARLSAGGGS
jgi:hypothetical protein